MTTYKTINTVTRQLAETAGRVMDFHAWWMLAFNDYISHADELNKESGLSIFDGRTRGGRYLKRQEREAWKNWPK